MDVKLIKEVADFLLDVDGKMAVGYSKLLNKMLNDINEEEHNNKHKRLTVHGYVAIIGQRVMYFRNLDSYKKYKEVSTGMTIDEAIVDLEYWVDIEAEDPETQHKYLILKGWEKNPFGDLYTSFRYGGRLGKTFNIIEAIEEELHYQKVLADPDKPMELSPQK